MNNIAVEHIERCVNELRLCKASVPDDLGAEHLRYAHHSVLLILKNHLDVCFCMDLLLIALPLV